MKLILTTTILLTLALWAGGCATLQQLAQPTTQPLTPSQRLDALQTDLDDVTAGANLAHALGAWKQPDEWAQIQGDEKAAQDSINAASKVVSSDPKTLADALDYAASLVVDLKAKAK